MMSRDGFVEYLKDKPRSVHLFTQRVGNRGVGPQIRNYAVIGVAYIPPHTGFHPKFFNSIDAR